jgi:hypothetical protein
MAKILMQRYERVNKLREYAIQQHNIMKVRQANWILKSITHRMNLLSHFSIN